MVEASITDKVSEFVYFRSNSIGLFLLQRDTYSKDNMNIYIYIYIYKSWMEIVTNFAVVQITKTHNQSIG